MSYHDSFEYNRFYYSTICHVCKQSNQNLKRCSICKTIAYCSRDHQKRDWKLHKNLCKAIAKADATLKYSTVHTFEDFRKYNVARSILWHEELSRKLYEFECQMWMFPRVCALCFSKEVAVDCPKCLNVSYCSMLHKKVHEKQHSEFCGALRLCMDMNLYHFHKQFSSTPEVTVHDFEAEFNTLPNNLQELMSMCENCDVPDDTDEMIKFIIKSDLVAPAATILYGMEKTGMIKDRFLNKSDLTIHIVGADAFTEMTWLWKLITELPFHWIKDLKSLNFYVVGPELNHEGVTEKFAQQLCDNCKEKHPKTKIIFYWKLYHEVVESTDTPDIVVAFNSGLHEFGDNLWHQSLDCLTMHSDVPLLLTAYTLDEIKQDVATLISKSNHKIDVVLEPQRNPFSNMTPIRDWETENSPVFYVNGYLAILKKRK